MHKNEGNMTAPIGKRRVTCSQCDGEGTQYEIKIVTPYPLAVFGRESKRGNFVIEKPANMEMKESKRSCKSCGGKGYRDIINRDVESVAQAHERRSVSHDRRKQIYDAKEATA
jgi:hypothetical protein